MDNINFRLEKIKKWYDSISPIIQMDLKGFDNLAQLNNIARLSRSFKGVFKPFQQFIELCEKAEADPNSVINQMKYEEAIEGFYWAWPYGITGEQIRCILEKCQIEIDFDQQMCQYFSKQKIRNIFQDTYNGLPKHHRMLFKQVEHAYWQKGLCYCQQSINVNH